MNAQYLWGIAACVLAYLMGSISFAVVVSHFMKLPDPHTYGSGNPGATNVLRTGNKKAAILTLLGDALKGFLAVFLAKLYFDGQDSSEWILPLVAAFVFIGHLFPVFHGFKGGKGVATACGVLLGINIFLGLATLLTWLIMAIFFRYSSLSALISAIFAPMYCFFLFGTQWMCLTVLAIGILLIWRHQKNIQNLFSGKEAKIGQKK